MRNVAKIRRERILDRSRGQALTHEVRREAVKTNEYFEEIFV